jgi:DNA gyrase inhibitor GyrI
MEPKVIIAKFPYEYAAFFQCIGGDEPIHSVYHNMAAWIKKNNLSYKNRIIAGFDEPATWCPDPYGCTIGCIGLYFIDANEIQGSKFRGVHVTKFDTSGNYATISINCHISKAWELLNQWKAKGKYNFDTESGRQYFEQHIFGDDDFTHDERLSFNIWMPVKKLEA